MRRTALIAGVAALAALLAAPTAGAATFQRGDVNVSIARSFAKSLNKAKASFRAADGGVTTGRRHNFGITNGTGTLAPRYDLDAALAGTLVLRKRGRDRTFCKLEE